MGEETPRHIVRVYVGSLSAEYEALSVEASKHTTADEIVSCIVAKLGFKSFGEYELAEVIGNSVGQECKERRIGSLESPVALKLLWPKASEAADSALFPSTTNFNSANPSNTCLDQYRFCLREKLTTESLWTEGFLMDPQIVRDYFYRFLYQPKDKEYPDLCQLPDLNESTLLENLKSRFVAGHIYTYVGSILIAVNPFKFHPIYNPKYVKLYQNRRREELPPHIFAIADSAYHTMLKERKNQCIVISGESGSGKTESTNFLLHHLTALSQKGTHGSGVEQTILSAGPVLEAFGNAKTAHNNNSSRFGKFIQVSYRENGLVHGAIVQKYLLEKSRICCQAKNERNYHVFYYLLAGASDTEKETLCLLPPNNYHYLNQSGCYTLDEVDECYEFSRLKQSMEMVGFGADKQRKLFCVLSAVLLLGNVEFLPKKSSYHHDESVLVKNPEVVRQISSLLRVTEETLMAALTSKRARVSGEMLVIHYRMPEAIAARNAMAKCLYGALFDWIVLQVNHALLSKKDPAGSESLGKSIGVLDIFGFENKDSQNSLVPSFEQFCINYANEHLQHYFNQHVFKYEQEEYKKEQILWTNIGFMDNTPCLSLIEAKPNGLICILDDQCNFPGATSETLLQKFNSVHKEHEFYEVPQKREAAFILRHYAGKVKYQVMEFREKNMDLMRHDIVSVIKNSSLAFVRELVGIDPVAVFRWAILRAFFRAYFAFSEAGRRHRAFKAKSAFNRAFSTTSRRRSSGNDHLVNGDENLDPSHIPLSRTDGGEIGTKKANRRSRQYSHHHSCRPYPNMSSNCSKLNNSGHGDGATTILPKLPNGHTPGYLVQEFAQQPASKSHLPLHSGPCCYPAYDFDQFSYVKNRSFRSHSYVSRGMKNLQSVKILASQTVAIGVSNKSYNPRKQPISVSAQFQQSLHSLMVTLNQANPFFIRCIKSNSDKLPNKFDDEIVLRQLRYTGMLETVRIRQAGYNVRLSFEEFIHIYRILLPRGLESTKKDIEEFLNLLSLNRLNYQIGETKVFLRESEKIKLDFFLHQQIMASIVRIQRWYRTLLERRHFIRVQHAIIKIQAYVRMFLAHKTVTNLRMRTLAATYIQKVWRGYRVRKWYQNLRTSCIQFQAIVRGNFARQRFTATFDQNSSRHSNKPKENLLSVNRVKGEDSHSGQSTDEAFLSKGSSQEELDESKLVIPSDLGDSEESSGVHEDSESESISSYRDLRHIPTTHRPLPSLSESMPTLTSNPQAQPHHWSNFSPSMSNFPHGFSQNVPQQLGGSPSLEKNSSQPNAPPPIKQRTNKKKSPTKNAKINKSEEEMNRLDEALSGLKRDEEIMTNVSKNPFNRAKKHIKTLIVGGNSKTKAEKEAAILDSESETEDTDTLTISNSSSTPSTITLDSAETQTTRNKNKESHLSLQAYHGESHRDLGNLKTTRSLQSFSTHDGKFESRERSEETRSRIDRREERRRLIEERAAMKNLSIDTSGERRESEESGSSSEMRRESRDSNQSKGSYASGSPSNSSQDSLFELRNSSERFSGREKERKAQGFSPKSVVVLTQSAIFGSTINSRKHNLIEENRMERSGKAKGGLGVGLLDFVQSRDVRRSRSVSETRKSHIDYPEHMEENMEDLGRNLTENGKGGITYHVYEKITKSPNACFFCGKGIHIFAPGAKCSLCQFLLHIKCQHNLEGFHNNCQGPNDVGKGRDSILDNVIPTKGDTTGRRKYRKMSKSATDMSKPGKFNLTGTSEFTDRTDQIISGVKELQLMQEFISKKIYLLKHKGEKENAVDRVFQQALIEFKDNLVSTFSAASKHGSSMLSIKYKDLIANFANIIETVCKHEGIGHDFPTTMGVNGFRGFLNEFMTANRVEEKPKVTKNPKGRKERRKKDGKRTKDEEFSHLGHTFISMVINIPTACEFCSSFIMWPIERGVVCQKCKLACHKKCQLKIVAECNESQKGNGGTETGIFGVSLNSLVSENQTVPLVVESLVVAIEMYGLRQEGLYRKSGVSSRVREVKQDIDEGKEIEDWGIYPVHVLTSVLKSFFREMPEPLLTFELYDEFLRAADLSTVEDRIQTIFSILKKLPKPNYDLMERLTFHLVRVAQCEDKNRMNANCLAIVFAPCILRTNKARQVQESLKDISRQTMCIETIILEQLKKVKATLSNIESVDCAAHSFSVRLNSIRSSKMRSPPDRKKLSAGSTGSQSEGSTSGNVINESSTPDSMSAEEEEEYLTRHLQHLKDEKALLTSVLPSLSRTPSDEDLLFTDPEGESPGGSADDLHQEAKTPSPRQSRAKSLQHTKLDSLVVTSTHSRISPVLRGPVSSPLLLPAKNRGPLRKPPSRFVRNLGYVDFGESEGEETTLQDEDVSVISVEQNEEEGIIV